MIELKKLSAEDGRDIYELLQEIPKEENGFGNLAHSDSFMVYLQGINLNLLNHRQIGIWRDIWRYYK